MKQSKVLNKTGKSEIKSQWNMCCLMCMHGQVMSSYVAYRTAYEV